jgi:pimeloyl-ACP methyl ester carboxylesterase
VLDRQTKGSEVTVEGGEIVRLPGGDLQVLDIEPAASSAPLSGAAGTAAPAPIVLLNCFTCSINWWDEMIPELERTGHRVVAIDLLGHGGSEKPGGGYAIEEQGQLVAQALGRLGVERPIVVGHSLGGAVAVELAEEASQLVGGVVIVDTAPDTSYGELSLLARAAVTPVIGEGLWRVKMDWSIRRGLEEAFAPGYEVPDQFIEDVKRMTYSSYDDSHSAFDSYVSDAPLDERLRPLGKPLLAIFGAEEEIVDDPREALSAYAGVDGAQTALIQGAGHSPNVEKPVQTARLILRFAASVEAAAPEPTTASAPRPSPNRPCARPSRNGQGSGARRGGGREGPGSVPARCRSESRGGAGSQDP